MARLGRDAAALAERFRRRWRALRDRLAARRAAALARPAALRRRVEPLAPGDAEAAAALAGGLARFAGRAVRLRGGPWTAPSPSPAWAEAMHGFAWLDDAAAAARPDAEALTGWALDWMRRYGGGSGPGWRADLAGLRLARLVAAAPAMVETLGARDRKRLGRLLGAHLRFLSLRWRAAPSPLGRLEAATGLALGGLALERGDRALKKGIAALGEAAAALVALDGGVATRNADDLARAFDLLAWTAHAFAEAGVAPDPRHLAALGRAGPALRTLRLGAGGLARFHGASGADGRLRRALALEIAVGRRRLIGSVGPGWLAGGEWGVAARATAAHSALEVGGVSSARIAPDGWAARVIGRPLIEGPTVVATERASDLDGLWALGEHDGYLARFGLVVTRRLNLSVDGATLRGEDTVAAPTIEARRRFDAAARDGGLPFLARFHLAPDVEAAPGRDPTLVVLTPPGAPSWVFACAGARPRIVESVWIDADGETLPARQIVLAGVAEAYFGRLSWSLHRERAGRA